MSLKTFVKAANITNLSDARYFAAFPVDWLSFEMNTISQKAVDIAAVKEMIGWLQGPNYCLQVAGMPTQKIEEIVNELDVSGLEVDQYQQLPRLAKKMTFFHRILVNPNTTINEITAQLRDTEQEVIYCLDFVLNGLTMPKFFDNQYALTPSEIKNLGQTVPLILAADFETDTINNVLDLGIKGIEISGGEEEKVGLRSFDDIQDVMEALDEWT